MFIYIYKFVVSFLMPPGILILALLVLLFMMVKHNYRGVKLLGGTIALFYILSMPYVGDGLLKSLEYQYLPPQNPAGDVIVMLGGGATLDTPDIDGLGHLSGSAANRLLTAVRLHNKLGLPIILSGGQVFKDSGTEALIGKRILLSLGVAADQIIVEDASLNTQQNAQYVNRILKEQGLTRPILVTSAFHMQRSVLNFQKQGAIVQPFPTDYFTSRESRFNINKFAPSPDALRNSYFVLHEYLGILAAKVMG
ncbi:MAG: YdcF family protein [Pelosinus sp.]|nr:YdcF family protein [Pelosinus sp.]